MHPQPRLGPIQDIDARLSHQYGELAQAWRTTREDWQDSVCEKFEQDRLQPIGPTLDRLHAAITEYLDIARQSSRELRDEGGD